LVVPAGAGAVPARPDLETPGDWRRRPAGNENAVSGRADTDAVREGPWRSELLDVVRAASGGLLFGVPLLYTMEIWWTGTHTSPALMLVVLGSLSLPVLALNMTAGFRASRDARLRDAIADTVEALAVGILVTAAVLFLLQEIDGNTSLQAALGKVVYECIPVCLGIGVARHFLTGRRSGDEEDGAGPAEPAAQEEDADSPISATVADLGATIVGAVFVSLSIAPTDEVPMIASAMSPVGLLALMAASLATSYAIVFLANFRSQEARHAQIGPFQRPITETMVSYLTSLAVAGLLLWLFQRGTDPPTDLLSRMVVLGFPAAIGGAAGRLAV
jgi:putative integral membrane protein (TIGR02587 family)